MIRDNPFLCAAFLAGLALAARESDVGSPEILGVIWAVLGFGFQLTVGLPEKLMPGIGPWLGAGMAIAIGLIPYLVCDVIWRAFRNR